MVKQLHEIQGMQVVALHEGRIMGSIQKVYLNPAKKRVSGMVVREPGFGGQESWIDIRDIDKVGENVLFVPRSAVCKAKSPVGRSLKDLMGMQVTAKDGKILGSLVDVEIDDEWRVVEIRLSEGRLVSIEPRHAVFGQDAILLRAGASSDVRAAPRHKNGFLARVFGIETVAETADAISRAEKTAVPAPAQITRRKKKKTRRRKG
jgi:sporulation protein YlmC with PRC-barrel domain